MRKLMLGMLLAAGAALPALATAATGSIQDRQPEQGQQREHDGERPHQNGGGNGGARPEQARPEQARPQQARPHQARPEQARPAPQAAAPAQPRPQAPAAAPQPQAQAQPGRGDGARYRGEGGYRGNDAARFNGGDPNRGASPSGDRGQQGGPGHAPDRDRPFDGRGGQSPYRQPGNQGQFRPGNPGNPGNWNRGWRGDNRFDWGRYRSQNRYAFHLPRYDAPYGWHYGYRRFSPGFTLYVGLFDRGFWIADPYDYRLPPAYYPYQWVRYYNDALLVDVRTGYVVDTVYDIFW